MTRKSRIVTLVLAAGIAARGLIAVAGDLNPPAGSVAPTQRTPVNANMTPGDADSVFKITLRGSYYLTGNISGVAAKHGIEITASGVTLDLNGFDLVGAVGSLDGVSTTVAGLTNIAVVNGSVRTWGDEGVDLATLAVINCRVADLLASSNTGNGISVGPGSTVSNCSAYVNGVNGIITGNGCTVSNCSAYQNTSNGINIASGCTVTHCSASINTSSGIITSSGCTVTDCTARLNALVGINVVTGCTVVDCSARENTLDGIACISGCIIRGNTCSSNGNGGGDGAGINAVSNDNRIEGNNCTGADRGIDVDAVGNIIIKNTCSGNATNWDIVAGNALAPIVAASTNAVAVVGNTYAGSLGSTDPNANFTY